MMSETDTAAMDRSAPEQEPRTSGLEISSAYISRFSRRAVGLFIMAAAILLIIFSLLGFGAFVFASASDIAARDISGGGKAPPVDPRIVEMRIKSLDQEIKLLQDLLENTGQRYDLGMAELLEVVQFDRELNAARGRLKVMSHKLLFHRASGSIPNLDIFESRKTLEIVRDTLSDDLKILKDADVTMRSGSEAARAKASGGEEKLEADLAALSREIEQSTEDAAYVKRLLDVGREAEGPVREVEAEESDELSGETLQILQTNITRFGTLLLIFFFIRIMLPIYRYFVGLGTIYNGQADALLLFKQTDEREDLGRLVATMTPNLGFEAAPSTPIENTLKLIKEIAPILARR